QGIFVARLLVAQANMSSRDTSRRVRRRRQADAEAGKPHRGGNRAFGYARDGVTIVEVEAALIRDAYDRIWAGTSPYALCAEWNRRGLRSPQGKLWRPQSLHVILTNPKLVGLSSVAVPAGSAEFGTQRWQIRRRADGTEVVGQWPAIIEDRARWEAVCARFAGARQRAGVTATGKNTRRYLLSGLLRCGLCGGRMAGQVRKSRKDGTPTYAYRCSEGALTGVCRGMMTLGMPVEDYVVEAALARHEQNLTVQAAAVEQPVAVWAGEADLARIERKLSEAHAAWKSDRLPAEDYFTVREELDADRARLRADQAAWAAARPQAPADPADMRARWHKPIEDDGLCLAAKREFLFRHLRAVQLADGRDPLTGKQRRAFNPDRLTLVWRKTLPAAGVAAGAAASRAA
ncbi:MAG TPA: recombinase family protein, partial [Streptomyces sp.]